MDFILSIVFIESLGDWSLTKYVQGLRKNVWYKVLGYTCYIGLLEMFQRVIEQKGLAWANTAWDGWSNITTGLVAFLYFKEKPTWKQFAGIVLVSLGIFFLGSDSIAQYNNGGK